MLVLSDLELSQFYFVFENKVCKKGNLDQSLLYFCTHMTQNLNEDIFVAKTIKPTESLFMYKNCKNNGSVLSNITEII